MKITLPVVRFVAGSARPREVFFASSRLRDPLTLRVQGFAIYASIGKPYVAAAIGLRTYERDLQIARRLKALAGIFTFAAMLVAFFITVAPLAAGYALGRAGERLVDVTNRAGYAVGDRFDEVADKLLPVRRNGIRRQFAALAQEVTR